MSQTEDLEVWGPTPQELAEIEQQIKESKDINPADRLAQKRILPKLFKIGNDLRAAGVSEDWIRRHVRGVAPSIKISSTPWQVAQEKGGALLKQWVEETT
jgi:hypothetical protein